MGIEVVVGRSQPDGSVHLEQGLLNGVRLLDPSEVHSSNPRLRSIERSLVTPNIGVDDGIDAARLLLPRCWFDEEKCRSGLEALTFYRKTFNERQQAFTERPVHDWSSHGADAFRGLAVRHKPPRSERARPRKRQLWAGRQAPAGRQGWMH